MTTWYNVAFGIFVIGRSHKEAAMTHIIHELRHYKKQLVEKIDATRCGVMSRSAGQPETINSRTKSFPNHNNNNNNNINHNVYNFNNSKENTIEASRQQQLTDSNKSTIIYPQTPKRKAMKSTTPHGKTLELFSSDNNDSDDASDSDSKELPDLVRSHNPSTSSSPGGSSGAAVPSSLIFPPIVYGSAGGVGGVARLPPSHPAWPHAVMSHQVAPLSMTAHHPPRVPGAPRLSSASFATINEPRVGGAAVKAGNSFSRRRADEVFLVFDEFGALDLSVAGRARRLFGVSSSLSSQIASVTQSSAITRGQCLYDDGMDCDNILDLSTRSTREGDGGAGGNHDLQVCSENSPHHRRTSSVSAVNVSSKKRSGKQRRHHRTSHKQRTTIATLSGQGVKGSRDGGQLGAVKTSRQSTVNPFGEVLRWTVDDVVSFVSKVPGCESYCEVCT